MPLTPNDPIAVADIRAACRRRGYGRTITEFVLADYRERGPHMLAAAVLSRAMTRSGLKPAAHNRDAVACGADVYVALVADNIALAANADPAADSGPGPDHDWEAEVAAACDQAGLSSVDRAYVRGRFDGEGWQAPAAWAALALGDEAAPSANSPESAARIGCAAYVRACLWLRQSSAGSHLLEAYGIGGKQWRAGGGEGSMVRPPGLTLVEPPPCAAFPSPSPSP